jgi:hypothetical protein
MHLSLPLPSSMVFWRSPCRRIEAQFFERPAWIALVKLLPVVVRRRIPAITTERLVIAGRAQRLERDIERIAACCSHRQAQESPPPVG